MSHCREVNSSEESAYSAFINANEQTSEEGVQQLARTEKSLGEEEKVLGIEKDGEKVVLIPESEIRLANHPRNAQHTSTVGRLPNEQSARRPPSDGLNYRLLLVRHHVSKTT